MELFDTLTEPVQVDELLRGQIVPAQIAKKLTVYPRPWPRLNQDFTAVIFLAVEKFTQKHRI